ncbi:putative tRNA pseudouridine synthase Pus10 [Podila epigama]|nr:putative tRNA pseudouridine synthase Pus10 [Podila epigama]
MSIELKTRLRVALDGKIYETMKHESCLDVLFSIPCCGRCMLRFLGYRDYEVYELSSSEIKEILATQSLYPPPKPTNSIAEDGTTADPAEPVCVACVGTVQYAESFVDEIVERMQKEGYISTTFNMNVTLPSSTLIRNHAIIIYYKERVKTVPRDLVDIKEIFKLLISWPLEARTGQKLDFSRKIIQVGDGRHNIVKALAQVNDGRFASGGHVPPTRVTTKPAMESIEITRESVYVGDFKFVTAGREDANVRMLGNGRPFYMEMINPRTPSVPYEQLKELEAQINAIMPEKVQVRNTAQLEPEDIKIIKDGEESKTKSYSALCWTSKLVTQAMIDAVNVYNNKSFIVEQQTPIRVLQRRAQMIRKKEIHSLKAFPLEGHFLVLHLHTEAGTYIKEFVHGDLGRNQPSLASILGCEADIMELDVLEVDLEFPPSIRLH